ncbi:ligand-binding sensor domain-containing protein [Clostridium aquiflavi]|uniref:histidine kinase n=1 Tax=Clostridium aquiflavi TaxID=3073603 RepID=A0ABU1EFN0_9CLOT|nr:two-component regulator propeller domain-containing protein [Clostridium sp. 5N-1]MDR5586764.1 two-component regulator propeller domain-containing protein [Clostridium sp. 5N-1]
MKKRLILKKIMIVVIFFSFLIINTQNDVKAYNNINFKSISIDDGLSQSSVEDIFQDSRGYIWIGTHDGLNKYNGKEFKVYKYEENSNNSISSNSITVIKEDKSGNLWVGTANGLSKINLKDDTIENYYDKESQGNLSNYNICDILITNDQKILVATADGLNIYNENEDKFERILYSNNQQVLTNQVIYSLDEDEDNNIWIGTENGLNKVNMKTKDIEFLYNTNNDYKNSIHKVYSDKNGQVWVGTSGAGLLKVDIKTNNIVKYKTGSFEGKREFEKGKLKGGVVKDILKDSRGVVWVCTDYGLSMYNEDEDNFTTYINRVYDKFSLINKSTFSIMEDSTGLMWVGTSSGISTFDPSNGIKHYKYDPFLKNTISDNSIQGIYEDSEGLVWIGTINKGLNIMNPKTENVTRINSKNSDLISDKIKFITGRKNEIWVATDNGLNKIDKNTNEIKVYTTENGLTNNKIRTLFIDNKDCLWIGTADGVNVLNLKDDTVVDMTYILKNNNIVDTYVDSIYQDKEGMYWIGLYMNGGLVRLDPRDMTIKNYTKVEGDNNAISCNAIVSIVEDRKNNIWIGTKYGLNKLDKNTEKFTRYTEKNGLANNNIYGILIDDYDNPWVSTNNGISKLDISNNTFTNLNISNRLQSNEFNGNSYFKNSKGEFLFGGINGLNIFNPSEINKNRSLPKVFFEAFEVKGKKYKNIDGLKFNSDENMVRVKMFVPDYKNRDAIKYFYKLEGIDSDWNMGNSNEFTYNNIKSGNHILKAKVEMPDGSLSDESQITFTIKPPLWKSKQAIILYLIISILIIYLSLNKMKNLDRMVEKRTKQLREEMDKNSKLLNKVIDLERNKNNYFVNLSHELRTPLNVISSTEQLISELNKQDDGIDKEKLNYYMKIIKRNSNRLLRLINNIIDTNKIESGRYETNFKENDIVYLVEETSLSLKDYIENKGIHLIIDPEVEEKVIMCDSYEIERCIVNLVSNAAKFTPEGGEIKVTLKDLNNKVIIKVKDTGIGIDPKYHKAIFDRFNQIVDANSESKGGSGLGLTITKHIIDLHKGKIYINSDIGKGCEFVIILPTNIE